LTSPDNDAISVVISTYQRPEACERALRSALEQTASPLEVLVCDDGSTDETEARMRAWERRDERVRYLRIPHNSGTPAATRNLGIEHARADLVAFLDDDDEWLPDKLAAQLAAFLAEPTDVIASNALRTDGSLYFADAPPLLRPTRAEMLAANPIITSSAVVRRSVVGFPTARWMRGIEDYAAWLALADRGTRFIVLGEPLLRYQDSSSQRLSAARAHRELAVARLAWRRAARRPIESASVKAAARKTAGAIYVVSGDLLGSVRARSGSAGARR
jgi:glycosyltransferase involved in cell wall biosynthesis